MKDNTTPETFFATGFEQAVIGLDTSNEPFRVIYDRQTMADILQQRDEMTEEEAWEYLDYNVFGAYVGEGTPIYVHKGDHERVLELISQL
tara:strand:- start:149 stop:418 length:270 start_codon:yes stop_codon:yes gene_type:complete